MATQSRAFAGYLLGLLSLPAPDAGGSVPILLILGFLLALAFVNFRGMRESMWLNLVCTTVEAAGLVIVIAVGIRFWGSVDYIAAPAPNVALSVKAPAEAMAWMWGWKFAPNDPKV